MVRWLTMLVAAAALGGPALAQTPASEQHSGQPGSEIGHPQTPIGQPATEPGHPPDNKGSGAGGDDNRPAPPTTTYSPSLGYTIEKLGKPDLGYGLTYGAGRGQNYHEDTGTGCKVTPAGGWMQPVQGVFQDDPQFPKVTFDYMHGAKPNPVINEVSPGVYTADLPMVAARLTVVMGVKQFRKAGAVEPGFTWYTIVFKGIGDCDVEAPVKFRLKLTDIGGEHTIWTSPVIGRAPIHGSPGGKQEPFQVLVDAYDGLPPKSAGAFVIPGPGSYTLTGELLDAKDGSPTGLQVVVSGPVVATDPPVVEFVPLSLSGPPSAADAKDFKSFADQVADAANRFLPDYFPVPPYGLPTFSDRPMDLSALDPHESDPDYNRWDWEAAAATRLGGTAVLSGATRIVALVRNGAQGVSDYGKVGSAKSVAMTSTTKVIFVSVGSGPNGQGFVPAEPPAPAGGLAGSGIVEDIGHELNHSEPDHLWSGETDARHNMIRDCGHNDHNTLENSAYGERLTVGSSERREYEQGTTSMMGSASSGSQWITQCAYAHLIYSFGHGVDPNVLVVRTILSQRNKVMTAKLAADYDQTGEVDATEGPAPEWAISVVEPNGSSKVYPIEPHWFSEENYSRDTLALLVHIPDPVGAARLEITYKGKVLASRDLAAAPPALTVNAITGAVPKGSTVHLSWSAPSGGQVLSSVFYSTNKGRWYVDEMFESKATSIDVPLSPLAKDHVIKIVVTDGGRSSEQLLRYTTP